MYHPIDRIAHTTAFVIPVMKHWRERKITRWVYHEDRSADPSHHDWMLYHGATSCSLVHMLKDQGWVQGMDKLSLD